MFLNLTCTLSQNTPNLASCSFDKHGRILVSFGVQHLHIFKNDVPIQLSLSLYFYVLYLLLNSTDGNDAKRNMFPFRLLVVLKEPVV